MKSFMQRGFPEHTCSFSLLKGLLFYLLKKKENATVHIGPIFFGYTSKQRSLR